MSDIHQIKQLYYDNFAGSGKVSINFNPGRTNIIGPNGSGKTTVHKAFNYLLYDKNHDDKKDFSIKNTKDLSKNRQETIVGGIWNRNGSDIELKKIFSEKWVKKHGDTELTFDGHTTQYFYNGVPESKSGYDAKIRELIDESISKLLTNVGYFNKMPWLKQREEILKLVPEVTDDQIASGNKKYQELLASLTNNKTLEEYKKEIKKKISDLKEEIRFIAPRIDQVKKTMPEAEDFEAMEVELNKLKTELESVEKQINSELQQDSIKNQAKVKLQQEINELKSERQQLEFNIETVDKQNENELIRKKQECRNSILSKEHSIKFSEEEIATLTASAQAIQRNLTQVGIDWDEANAREYESHSGDFTCEKCGSKLTGDAYEGKKEELKKNFIEAKNQTLQKLNEAGMHTKKSLDDVKAKIADFEVRLSDHKAKIEDLKAEFLVLNNKEVSKTDRLSPENVRITDIILEIAAKEDKLNEDEPIDQSELILKKSHISASIDFLRSRLYKKEQIEQGENMIKDLMDSEASLAQKQASYEKIDFTIRNFEQAKTKIVEDQINDKFKFTKFKLFDALNDGTLVETCVALSDSTPWQDANTANQVLVSLDIIATFQDFYELYCPVFLDGAESVQNIPEMKSQLITMTVGGVAGTGFSVE